MSSIKKKSIMIPGIKRALFLYNPVAGDGRVSSQVDTVIRMYQKDGYLVDVLRIDGTIDLSHIFKKFDDSYSQILIGGGDGTVNSVVNEMMNNDIDLPIGILPMGTANDFANYIGMTQNVEECMRQILTLPVQHMDIGRVNGMYFVNVFSLGFFTDISQKTEVDLKNTIGKLAYYLKSLE
ncbi:MAG: diacylglycerol kinase family protein, partial [Clostridiaceae bacterium]